MKRRIRREAYPAGRQPYDTLNGLRVGAVAGGIIGMIPVALDAPGGIWAVVGGAVVGGIVGYLWERRQLSKDTNDG